MGFPIEFAWRHSTPSVTNHSEREQASTPLQIASGLEVRSCPGMLEPEVAGLDLAGISRPVVLLPQGILVRLTPAHLEAVLAHEF